MLTRSTFRYRDLAWDALKRILRRRGFYADGTPEQIILSFANRYLHTNEANGKCHAETKSECPIEVLDRTIDRLVHQESERTPFWARRAEAVLHLSERMLGVWPGGRTLDALDPQTAVHRSRKRGCGTYSTPHFIVDSMCRSLLDASVKSRRSRIEVVDFSLEGGHFPLSMLKQPGAQRVRFFGIDRDPVALALARRIVRFASRRAAGGFEFRSCRMDSFRDPLPSRWPEEFDAVIGNPPWKTSHPTDAAFCRERFAPYLKGKFDIYLAFMLAAHARLKPGGLLSMVVPSQFLFNQNAASVRKLLLDEYELLRLDVYPRRSFVELSALAPISFLARKRVRARRRRVTTEVTYHEAQVGHGERRHSRTASLENVWRQLPGNALNPLVSRESLFLASTASESRLGDWGRLACGAKFGGNRSTPSPRPFLGVFAANVRPFHTCLRGASYFSSARRLFAPIPSLELLDTKKIVLQSVRCVTMAARLVAGQAEAGVLAISSTAMFVPGEAEHVDFFEALLNSQFANAWYKLRDVSLNVRLNTLEQLPIVRNPPAWQRIASLGREIGRLRRALHHRVPQCGVSDESQQYAEQFPKTWTKLTKLRSALDESVFDMYSLSPRQRSAVVQFSAARIF